MSDDKKFTVVCPFAAEIYGNFEPSCNCPEDQQEECARDV